MKEEADESLYRLELLTEGNMIEENDKVSKAMKEAEELTAIFVSIKQRLT